MAQVSIPADTDPAAFALLVERWRSMSVAERVDLVDQVTADVERMARAGIRATHPEMTEPEIRHELAVVDSERRSPTRPTDTGDLMAGGPLALVRHMAGIFDELGLRYALGGSMASSLLGEPRSTVDVDMAVAMDPASGEALLERVGPRVLRTGRFRSHRDPKSLFVQPGRHRQRVEGRHLRPRDGLLDRMQIERRVLVQIPGAGRHLGHLGGRPGAPEAGLVPTGGAGLGPSVAGRRRHPAGRTTR